MGEKCRKGRKNPLNKSYSIVAYSMDRGGHFGKPVSEFKIKIKIWMYT